MNLPILYEQKEIFPDRLAFTDYNFINISVTVLFYVSILKMIYVSNELNIIL